MGNNKKNKNSKQQKKRERAQKTQRRMMFWTIGAVLVVFATIIIYNTASVSHATHSATASPSQETDQSVFQYQTQPSLGSKTAPVKIVEFADFKCPVCKQFDETIFPQLKKDFLDTGIAQLYFINKPIISPDGDSKTAAMAGEAVYHQNPAEFWKFYQAVYANQQSETSTWATSDTLVKIAEQSHLNLDFTKMKADIDNNTYAQDVNSDETIANQLGVDGTPTVYINGTELSINDTFNYNAFKNAILKAKGGSQK